MIFHVVLVFRFSSIVFTIYGATKPVTSCIGVKILEKMSVTEERLATKDHRLQDHGLREPIPTPAQLITVDALHLELFAAFVNHSEYLVEFAHLLPILDATRVLTNRMQLDTIAAMRHHADEVCERDSKPVKPSIKFPLPVLLTGLGLILAGRVTAQTFTTLHSFTAASTYYTNSEGNMYPINSDGGNPAGEVILSGNTIYGTALYGGSSANGTVYKINTDGTGFTNLHSFTATPPYFTNSNGTVVYTNNDGAIPLAGLILSGNTLYGTAYGGGSSGYGTVFAVNTDGTGFTNLHTFMALNITNSGGAYPYGGLVVSGHALYGTAFRGGRSGAGTVFSLSFAPQLTITPSGANVIFTWPTNVARFAYTGLTLQSTTNLVSAAVWTTVSPGPFVIGGKNTVTNLISGTQQFYRLSQ